MHIQLNKLSLTTFFTHKKKNTSMIVYFLLVHIYIQHNNWMIFNVFAFDL